MLKARWQWQMLYLATKRNVSHRWSLVNGILWKTANLEQRAHLPTRWNQATVIIDILDNTFFLFFLATIDVLMKQDTSRTLFFCPVSLGSIHGNGVFMVWPLYLHYVSFHFWKSSRAFDRILCAPISSRGGHNLFFFLFFLICKLFETLPLFPPSATLFIFPSYAPSSG